jgi:hypothetical protein
LGHAVSDELPPGVIDMFPINLKQGQLNAHFFDGLKLRAPSVMDPDRLAQTSRTFDF